MDYDKAESYWRDREQDQKSMPEGELWKEIESYIKAHNTCAMATGSGDFVRCTPLEYNYLEQSFYIFSEGGLKFHGLRDNKNICLAIYDAYKGFGKLGGVQIMGQARIIEPFSEEYNQLLAYKKIPEEAMRKLPSPMHLIKVVPSEIDYLNSDLKKAGYDSRQHLKLEK